MSQSTTPNAANNEPRLCKMGCGFFGSGATEDCCSKCFLEKQKKMNSCQVIQPSSQLRIMDTSPSKDMSLDNNITLNTIPQPMDIESTITSDPASATDATANDVTILKKKKKKTSYKAMMAAMTTSDAPRDIEKEKDSIRKATGGGAFSKIDKI